MSNKIKDEINKIEIPKKLNESSRNGISKAKVEMPKRYKNWSKIVVFAASLIIGISGYFIYENMQMDPYVETFNGNSPMVTSNGGLDIPTLKLPKTTNNTSMSMIGLIVYNQKIYTQTSTDINDEHAGDLLEGKKIGTTKNNLDEWSKQNEYSVEFASTIGRADVYTVKGYDKDFRIMSYSEENGEINSEFYESLNGITVYTGQDILGKLKVSGNIINAQYRSFSDWNNSVDNFLPIQDRDILSSFAEELNHTVPYSRESVEKILGDFRNDENYKEMIFHLKDHTKVSLVVIKGGYIRYGFSDIYFKMDSEIFKEMWEQLNIL
ncbi:hypothetical protein [Paenisporosarcina sp. TG20]|uniref:hypothetical protein n=1 Tax=Paenisporosarcina sp. TG20 TaxID=1211706 RepID=UPI00030A559C|nr:hypothetical protein [Paenisporosarcina sp. TG20]